jgi:hypothetical protein
MPPRPRPRPRGSLAPFLVWALFGAVAVAIFVTYSRLPARDLWKVSGSGPLAGAGRVLVFTNYSAALAAVMILVLLLDRLRNRSRRLLALVAIGLCAVGPVFVDSSNLDARWVNGLAAVGVGIAFVLTLSVRSPSRRADGIAATGRGSRSASWCSRWRSPRSPPTSAFISTASPRSGAFSRRERCVTSPG